MPSLRFHKPGIWPTLAAAAGIALTVALGNWQLGRGHDKTVLAERLESASRDALITLPADEISSDDVVWRRVEVRGRFEPKYTVFIDNRVLHGIAGYHVVTPLKIRGGERYVLVNRGWVAGTDARNMLPQIVTPADEVLVLGLATVPSTRYFELSPRVAEGNVWQNLTLARYREAVPIAIQPVVIRQENDLADGLERVWDAPDLGIQMHYGYAFQWFALAATILIFYLVAYVRKNQQQPD
jgi:surfeit locus 1 family protein